MILPANATRISIESALVGRHLVALGVAVEDGGELVLRMRGTAMIALRGAAQPRQRLARARGLGDVPAHRLLVRVWTLRKTVSAASGMLTA